MSSGRDAGKPSGNHHEPNVQDIEYMFVGKAGIFELPTMSQLRGGIAFQEKFF